MKLYVPTITLLFLALVSCGNNSANNNTNTANNNESAEYINKHDLDAKDVLPYEVSTKENNSGQIEIHAFLRELPKDSLQLAKTVRYIGLFQTQDNRTAKVVSRLYLSNKQAANEDLKSEWIAQYFYLPNANKKEEVMMNKDKMDIITGNVQDRFYIDGLTHTKEYLSKKGIDFCELHLLTREWEHTAHKEADNMYEMGSIENYDQYEKSFKKLQEAYRKKHSIPVSKWQNIWPFGELACDNYE